MQHRMLRAAAATLATSVTALGLAGPALGSALANSTVYVVHGIPGQAVDVYVNGAKTLTNFEPTKVAGPLDLPEGAYDIVLTKPGDPITTPILKVDDAAVPGGRNLSLVAHLNAGGQPTLTLVRERHVPGRGRQGPADRAAHCGGARSGRACRRRSPSRADQPE